MDSTPTPSGQVPPTPATQAPAVTPPQRRIHPAAVAAIAAAVLLIGYGAYAYVTGSGPFATREPVASESPGISLSGGRAEEWDNMYSFDEGFNLRYPSAVNLDSGAIIGPEAREASGSAESGVSATIAAEATALADASQLPLPACAQHRTATTVASYTAISFDGCDVAGPLQVKWIVNGKLFTAVIYSDRDLVLRILSTFELIPYAGWEFYWNDDYGFELHMPPAWAEYVARIENVPGATAGVQIAYSATAELPAQSFTILVYTPAQWEAEMRLDQPHPQELKRSAAYVFATPFRFESTDRPGEADIPAILESFQVRH